MEVWGESVEREGACLSLIPTLCSHLVSFVPWGKPGRYPNTCEPRLADTSQGQSASPAQWPGSCQSWLLGPWARKRHFSLGHLTLCHSFQTLPLFFTLKSAPDTIFKTLPYLFLFKPNLRIQYYTPGGYRSHAHTSRYLLSSQHVFEQNIIFLFLILR